MLRNTNVENKFNIFNKIKIAETLVAVYIGYCLLENKIIVKNKCNKIRDRTMLKLDSMGLSLCVFALKRYRAGPIEYE